MHTIVCLKQVVDPELPPWDFGIDPATKRQVRTGKPLVISTYDENALELALQLKERVGGKVTALTIGPAGEVKDAVRLALAMGADEAVVVDDADAPLALAADKAQVLAAAIGRLGSFDLVLTGCESADWVERAVAPFLAEALEAACVTFVTRAEVREGGLTVRRTSDEGFHVVDVRLPAVLSVTSDESLRPRLPKVKDIMGAMRKPVQTWTRAELGAAAGATGVEVREVAVPQRTTKCEFIEGDPAQQAEALVSRLRALKII
ncbi:MAG: electron transfer flavoprotein subunit beta/FixA family protein [Armatimonadota bacterium]|nr:electron transfer flavoprotein subunit beta/FixA family protein [Armatimonadota bacterium]MDR7450365.1 electron transfer flavoprotein subunit beta/FixA family protein [Armatimonadota bacterium]MDR7467052.1 electron transfer flavoprotein subunit beta/FixA family protein [Armatimonadota bacterium]MDR7493406.1 electron transfer flavoprotein subunit beta/FixA family protein [Armatimonadota bacterium]MDR7498671.1 electron transfer flavoprotein subunit beta/FixA family protein [Armatimonadota bact